MHNLRPGFSSCDTFSHLFTTFRIIYLRYLKRAVTPSIRDLNTKHRILTCVKQKNERTENNLTCVYRIPAILDRPDMVSPGAFIAAGNSCDVNNYCTLKETRSFFDLSVYER